MYHTVATRCENIHICGILMQFDLDQVSSSFSSFQKEGAAFVVIEGEIETEVRVEICTGIRSGINKAICHFECGQTGVLGVQSVFSHCCFYFTIKVIFTL